MTLVAPDVTGTEKQRVLARVDHLERFHRNTSTTRSRIRDIMNGGEAGIRALLGEQTLMALTDSTGRVDDVPSANFMLSGLERLAWKIGRAPTLRVPTPANRDSDRARRQAEKRERIVEGYDNDDGLGTLEEQLPQIGRWLPGYGFVVWVIRHWEDDKGNAYPQAHLRDPFDCYPGPWGANQEPPDLAIIRKVPKETLITEYPQNRDTINSMRTKGPVMLNSARWEGQQGDIEVVEYYDRDATWVIVRDIGLVLEHMKNPIPRPRFVVAKRYSFDSLSGQYDQLFGLMAYHAKINVMSLIFMEQNIMAPTNIFGEIEDAEYKFGLNEVNRFTQGTKVERPAVNLPVQAFQLNDRVERQLRLGANYPIQDDGQSPNSFATGRGLERLEATTGLNTREYQTVLRHGLQKLDKVRLMWDEAMYGGRSKPILGSATESYDPARDIAGNYRTIRKYGPMADLDSPEKIIGGLQLRQGGAIDNLTFQEMLDGLDNLPQINERLRREKAENVFFEALLAQAQAGDPKAQLAAVEIFKDPGNMDEVLTRFYTPEEPQMSPEQEAMVQPQQPPDIQTVLSRLSQNGATEGGAQIVSRSR